MRIGVFLTIVVYGLVFFFIRKTKMPTYGDYLQQKREAESSGQSYQRSRTTFNIPQRTSSPMKPQAQQQAGTRFPKPIRLNNSFGMGKEKDDYITREKGKNGPSFFERIGKNKEVDCGLDERIFGSRHQHKDIF